MNLTGWPSLTDASDAGAKEALEAQLHRARAQIAALEQLLEVHEQTSLEQATRLERSLRERGDLLERERAAHARLAESEERLRLALEAGRMGTWEWDITGNRVIWSAEEERLYGIPAGTFSGRIEEYGERIHPDDREASLAAVRAALERRAPTHHVLHRIVWPDGQVRWLDSHARFIYAPDGTPQRLVGVSTDVTEQRTLQRQVEFERTRLQEVLMQAPAVIVVTEGPEHVIGVSNEIAEQFVGPDVVGKRLKDVLPEIEGQGFLALLDSVFRTGTPFVGREMPVRLERPAGGAPREAFFNFVYHPLRNMNGEVYAVLTHAVEVTDQVRARQLVEEKVRELARLSEELERSNRELDQFAYVASHDLKAPLRGIANLTQWIEEDLGDRVQGESREHMQLLKGRVNRMEALIDGILAYSRAGRVREKTEEIDVGTLLADTVELLSPPPHVTIAIEPPMPVLTSERVPLQQVFMNLVGNAIKYNEGRDPRVTIRATEDGEAVRFAVADNGPGIAPQFQDRIWQIFQTLAPRDKVEGTGIGLSVVKKLVETRGGRVWLESQPGHGSTFYFTWPRNPRTQE